MSLDELAREVSGRGLYVKRDGSSMGAGQINRRTRQGGSYDHIFERDGRLVRLRGVSQPIHPPTESAADEGVVASDRLASAIASLAETRYALADADLYVPDQPGQYAIYGSAEVWDELGLGDPPDDRPLYVGKSESSLAERDLRDHFGDGSTGWSTVRRTFAAMLHDVLELRGIPRNPARPERFANYGLSPAHDAALTKWMRDRLFIAVWGSPAGAHLATIEQHVLDSWLPPLNLKGVLTEWTGSVKAARAVMAVEARTAVATSSGNRHTKRTRRE